MDTYEVFLPNPGEGKNREVRQQKIWTVTAKAPTTLPPPILPTDDNRNRNIFYRAIWYWNPRLVILTWFTAEGFFLSSLHGCLLQLCRQTNHVYLSPSTMMSSEICYTTNRTSSFQSMLNVQSKSFPLTLSIEDTSNFINTMPSRFIVCGFPNIDQNLQIDFA